MRRACFAATIFLATAWAGGIIPKTLTGTVYIYAQDHTPSLAVPLSPTDLPPQVDNSLLKYFPPIRSQGSVPSCSAFAITYYTHTYMVARAHDWDVRTSTSRQMSPRFTANLGNIGGANSTENGTTAILMAHGCATWAELPYTDNDVTSFPTSVSVWRSALRYRISSYGYVSDVDTDAGLLQLKAMLHRGFILNFGTGAPDLEWHYKNLSNDPATNADDAFAGQKVGFYLSGNGSHEMTVVGYNDNLWVDINGNGKVDLGEKGALKIANSWGASWANSGFAWLAYDALKKTTAVKGWTSPALRFPAFWIGRALWMSPRAGNYTPTLLAECTVSHAKRNQIEIQGGYGGTSALAPDSVQMLSHFSMAGTLAFNGTMVFDLTDFADAGASRRWFVGFRDKTSDATSGTFTSCKLTDALGNVLAQPSGTVPAGGLPQTANGSTVWAYASLQMADTVAPAAVTDLSAGANATQVTLWWTAPGDDGLNGVADSYEIRYSAAPITSSNWPSATLLASGVPLPKPAGAPESSTISGLAPGSTWYAGLVSKDEAGHTSALSNIAVVTLPQALTITTASHLPDAPLNQPYSANLTATGGTPPYTWREAGGYVEEVQGSGTLTAGVAQNWHGDSAQTWQLAYPAGFKFPFCGIDTTRVSVSAGGLLQFPEVTSTYLTNMLMPFRSSLSTTGATEDIFVDAAADHVTLRWKAHLSSEPSTVGTINFQVTLYPNGQFRFDYGNTSGKLGVVGTFVVASGGVIADWTEFSVLSNAVLPVGASTLFSVARMPPGLALDPSTGTISGTLPEAGAWAFKIAAMDNADLRITQRVVKGFSLSATANLAPAIDSAPWANPNPVTLPASAEVSVVASDPDHGPAPLTCTWSKVSGPGTSSFSSNGTAASATSTASFSEAGSYVLRLAVSDGEKDKEIDKKNRTRTGHE